MDRSQRLAKTSVLGWILTLRQRELFLAPPSDPAGLEEGRKRSEPRTIVYCYDGGIIDFVKHVNRHKDAIHPRVIHFEGEDADQTVELAMQWNAGYNDNVFSFANNINTHEGGTHLSGFRAAITRTINDYARSKGFLKERTRTSVAKTSVRAWSPS